MAKPEYLGDSVYIDTDGFYLVLTTDNGEGATSTIYLDPSVYAALVDYVSRLKQGG